MPLKILHCIHSIDPVGGGPVAFVRQLTEACTKLGVPMSAEVVSMDAPGNPNISKFPSIVHALGPGFLNYGFSPSLLVWLKEHRKDYDLLVVHGLWQYPTLAVWLALRGTDSPYVVFPHGMLDPWFNQAYPVKHLKKRLYWPFADFQVLRDAQAVLFTSREERDLARQSFRPYRCRETVVNFATEEPPEGADIQLSAFYTRFSGLKARRIILFFGRIHEKKGPHLLLDAFIKQAYNHSLQLVFAGPAGGAFAEKLKKRSLVLGDRVTWTGMLTGDVRWGALRAAEAMVLPSHQENFALSVSESLSCGTPVLISNRVNIWREILESGAGLVENDDLAGTERLLSRWFGLPPEKRQEIRDSTRACYDQNFNLNTNAPKIYEVFRMCSAAVEV